MAYDHRVPIGDATLLLHGEVRFFTTHDTSRVPQDLAAAAANVRVPSEAMGDLNATLLFGPHYSITAYVRNITDNRFIPDGWGLQTTTEEDGPALSDPRTFGVILAFKY